MVGLAAPALCIAGLGNPGERYEATRHNVGFEVVDVLAARAGTDIRRSQYGALTGEGIFDRTMVLLMKPQTYMNASGSAVAAALDELGLPPEHLVVVYDDLDLPLGRLRVRESGGAGGHRGIASIVQEIGTDRFVRVRVGIGRPFAGIPVIEHVLSPFFEEEVDGALGAVVRAADAVEHIAVHGVRGAMEAFNGA